MIDSKPTTNGHAPPTSQTQAWAALDISASAGSRMTHSRVIGALFLLAFLSYGIGSGLVTSVVGGSNSLSIIAASQALLVLGAFLMLLHTYRGQPVMGRFV